MTAVAETVSLSASPDDVWSYIGDFGNVADWHPAVVSCDMSEDGADRIRTLTLGDGSRIIERLDAPAGGERSYTYSIVDAGPLPVQDYQSTIDVTGGGDVTTITWSSEFKAAGAPEADAQAAISGVYTGGFDALVEKFGSA